MSTFRKGGAKIYYFGYTLGPPLGPPLEKVEPNILYVFKLLGSTFSKK